MGATFPFERRHVSGAAPILSCASAPCAEFPEPQAAWPDTRGENVDTTDQRRPDFKPARGYNRIELDTNPRRTSCAASAAASVTSSGSQKETIDVHRHEPLPGGQGFGRRVRADVAGPRQLPWRDGRIRGIPSAEGPRGRGPHALFLAYGMGE